MDLADLELIALGALAVTIIVIALWAIRRARKARSAAPLAPAPAQPVAFLERTSDDEGPRIYALNKPMIAIGRGSDNDIVISSDAPGGRTVSRRHAQIRREDLDFVVEDLGSQNGIKVNGLATRRNLLRHGYRVSLGSVDFQFRVMDADEEAGAGR